MCLPIIVITWFHIRLLVFEEKNIRMRTRWLTGASIFKFNLNTANLRVKLWLRLLTECCVNYRMQMRTVWPVDYAVRARWTRWKLTAGLWGRKKGPCWRQRTGTWRRNPAAGRPGRWRTRRERCLRWTGWREDWREYCYLCWSRIT